MKGYLTQLTVYVQGLLRDIQWDFTVCFNGYIGLDLSRNCSILSTFI